MPKVVPIEGEMLIQMKELKYLIDEVKKEVERALDFSNRMNMLIQNRLSAITESLNLPNGSRLDLEQMVFIVEEDRKDAG